MTTRTPTLVWDRRAGRLVEEQIFGDAALRFGYEHPLGRRLTAPAALQRWVSRGVGAWQRTRRSARAVPEFVRRYGIELSDYVVPAAGFESFDAFFTRPLAPGARSFPAEPGVLGAAAEGRLTVFPLPSPAVPLVVKGQAVSLAQLVGSASLAERYLGGHAYVFRLCPVDYHRFHFPDAGVPGPATRHGHALHSVHPVAHARVAGVFLRNERQVCAFESERFGTLAMLEVGAMCVGRIVQTYVPGIRVARGAEKGYFAFGGSTTIVLTERTGVVPDADLLEHTARGTEVLVRLGEPIGRAP